MPPNQKLELTWIGKDDEPKLEPRILIEDREKSFGDRNSQNMLIHGDNLLALKALEQDFAGKIKCIYIDPPFNTGAAFDHYDDSIEHSIWLNLMIQRFNILYRLLTNDGVLFVHLDDNEAAYCKVLLDEIFGRSNYVNQIVNATNKPFGFKSTSGGLFKQANHIFLYCKDKISLKINPSVLFIEKEYDSAYNMVFENLDKPESEWSWRNINEVVASTLGYNNTREAKNAIGTDFEMEVAQFALVNAKRVFQTASVTGGALQKRRATIEYSKIHPNLLVRHPNDDMDYLFLGGRRVLFYSERLKDIEGMLLPGELLTDMWTDISIEGLAKEGGVDFPKGKKPEKLIQRCIELTTNKDDWVFDSFLGSGTTSAVAHKLERNWIGVEIGEQAYTHCLPRLTSVVDGTDQTGISRSVNWKGGGGFKYYYLAPSLLQKDKYDNWIIDKSYNPEMLAAAMAKHEGFRFNPDEQLFWKQGQSTEKDFIFTTTTFITVEYLDKIHEEMKSEETLLICCRAFQEPCEERYANINIKKIPQMLLGRCEFGKDDYSLNIVNVPLENEPDPAMEQLSGSDPIGEKVKKPVKSKARKQDNSELTLF
ncbi:MAG: site-specific DNA-methyltransferase [Bacteroidota bacterium]